MALLLWGIQNHSRPLLILFFRSSKLSGFCEYMSMFNGRVISLVIRETKTWFLFGQLISLEIVR